METPASVHRHHRLPAVIRPPGGRNECGIFFIFSRMLHGYVEVSMKIKRQAAGGGVGAAPHRRERCVRTKPE
jgi:hypothetical protein